ncbi:MAG: 6-carboxytetrahydropterin synthase QueD [Deltaproteobacteria bacterium]|nr:6-carboxytetrahydropterin synthase QueD [Deltaproteobacteria bacterium]
MRVELCRDYRFEAAHRLPRLPDGHKCKRLHGHSFRFEVTLAGEVDDATGFLMDFGDVDRVVAPVVQRLDHFYLNEIQGLENPTSEILSRWLWRELKPSLPLLSAITVSETCDSRCIYRGE